MKKLICIATYVSLIVALFVSTYVYAQGNLPTCHAEQQQKLISTDSSQYDEFGEKIDVGADTMAAFRHRVNAGSPASTGAIDVFQRDNNGRFNYSQTIDPGSDVQLAMTFAAALAVSPDGNRIAIGTPNWEAGEDRPCGPPGEGYPEPCEAEGRVDIFERDFNGAWQKVFTYIPAPDTDAELGRSVDIDGDVLVVGAPKLSTPRWGDGGHVLVFRFDGQTWQLEQSLFPTDAEAGYHFGSTLALSGNRLISGSRAGQITPDDDSIYFNATGAAWFFHFDGNQWLEKQKVYEHRATNSADSADDFGRAVDIQGDLAVVGMPDDYLDNVDGGSALVYRFDGQNWQRDQELRPSDHTYRDRFGYDVSLSAAGIVAVSRPSNSLTESGAYSYRHNGGQWQQIQKLQPKRRRNHTGFGHSVVALDQEVLVSDPVYYGRAAGHIYRYPVPAVAFDIVANEPVQIGDTITLNACGGSATNPLMLHIASPTTLSIPSLGSFNSNGVWTLSAPLLNAPANVQVDMSLFTIDHLGRIIQSNSHFLQLN